MRRSRPASIRHGFTLNAASKYFAGGASVVRAPPTDKLQVELHDGVGPRLGHVPVVCCERQREHALTVQAIRRLEPEQRSICRPDRRVPASTRTRTISTRRSRAAGAEPLGGTYTFNYDLLARQFPAAALLCLLQCPVLRLAGRSTRCSTSTGMRTSVPQDRRFNVSFTLAGIGTFSNFLGAFGGGDRPVGR